MQHLKDGDDRAARDVLALSVALAHPALSTDPSILCTAASVCTAWQQAVQRCRACNTHVVLEATAPLLQLSSFARWLPKHAGLVSSLVVAEHGDENYPYWSGEVNGMPWCKYLQVFEQLLLSAIRLAALLPAAAERPCLATAATKARSLQANYSSPQQQQQQQQQVLRLASFSCCIPGAAAMLSALRAPSLAKLNVHLTPCSAAVDASVAAALAHHSNLQQLRLELRASCGSCLASISQLKQLTSLSLTAGWLDAPPGFNTSPGMLSVNQLMMHPLPLRRLQLSCGSSIESLDLTALTQLEWLSCEFYQPDPIALPLQLQQLELRSCKQSEHLNAVMQLQQLQRLTIRYECAQQEPLLRLTQLASLQHLALEMYLQTAVATAAAWPQLPQLQELSLFLRSDYPQMQQIQAILAGVAACTSLTKLDFEFQTYLASAGEEESSWAEIPAAACASLAGLTQLRNLALCGVTWRDESPLTPGDALSLAALTGLTRLELGGQGDGVGDLAACAVACRCKQLQHLDLQGCDLGSGTCLAAIAQLTQLTELWLEGNMELTQQGLLLLTALSRLQRLGLTASDGTTQQVLQSLGKAVKLHQT